MKCVVQWLLLLLLMLWLFFFFSLIYGEVATSFKNFVHNAPAVRIFNSTRIAWRTAVNIPSGRHDQVRLLSGQGWISTLLNHLVPQTHLRRGKAGSRLNRTRGPSVSLMQLFFFFLFFSFCSLLYLRSEITLHRDALIYKTVQLANHDTAERVFSLAFQLVSRT